MMQPNLMVSTETTLEHFQATQVTKFVLTYRQHISRICFVVGNRNVYAARDSKSKQIVTVLP